jgi:hypothetical protein
MPSGRVCGRRCAIPPSDISSIRMNVVDFPGRDEVDPRIVTLLIDISKKMRATIGLRLAEIGLATGEDDILLAIRDGRTTSASELSRSMGIRFPTLVKAVDGLVGRNLLDRVTGPMVKLSHRGALLVPGIVETRKDVARDLVTALGADVVERLTADLEELDQGLGSSLVPMGQP